MLRFSVKILLISMTDITFIIQPFFHVLSVLSIDAQTNCMGWRKVSIIVESLVGLNGGRNMACDIHPSKSKTFCKDMNQMTDTRPQHYMYSEFIFSIPSMLWLCSCFWSGWFGWHGWGERNYLDLPEIRKALRMTIQPIEGACSNFQLFNPQFD